MSVNILASRSRSLRLPAAPNTSKPPPPVQQQIAISSTTPSNISLFLTNLRLLDLDLRADWPGITELTFSTRDAQQNQKKRIQCVEWALYWLFSIWDPEETRDKLQPFFPPLEHLQSLNLRAALFRCLDQAKKNGLLGRDAVLRKTMLDECKGERLEEVLAIVSTTVLKKVVQNQASENHEPIVQRLAIANFSYSVERTALSTLILAHKSSLNRNLSEKRECKARYKDFAELLDLKERQTIRRQEQLLVSIEESSLGALSDSEARSLRDKVEKNWTGSNEWLNSILHGNGLCKEDAILGTSFDDIWKHVEDGNLGDIEYQDQHGLLEQLDARVRQQNHRLAKWQSFERALSKETKPKPRKESSSELTRNARGIDLGFTKHGNLQLSSNPRKSVRKRPTASLDEYSKMLENMQNELANVGKPRKRATQSNFQYEDVRKEASVAPGSLTDHAEVLLPDTDNRTASNTDTEEPSPGSDNCATRSRSPTPPSDHSDYRGEALSSRSVLMPSANESNYGATFDSTLPSNLRHASSHSDMPPPSPPSRPSSPLASEILASVFSTSPSPTKPRHVLSLAERMRLSMSRASISKSNFNFGDLDEDTPDLTTGPRAYPDHQSGGQHASTVDPVTAKSKSGHEDLIARTRQSMSNFSAVQKTVKIDRRRSIKATNRAKRNSFLPKPLETAVEDGNDTFVLEGLDKKKLIEGELEVDYDVVFKSRPKIKTSPERSPVRSPVKAWGDMGGVGEAAGSSSPIGG